METYWDSSEPAETHYRLVERMEQKHAAALERARAEGAVEALEEILHGVLAERLEAARAHLAKLGEEEA